MVERCADVEARPGYFVCADTQSWRMASCYLNESGGDQWVTSCRKLWWHATLQKSFRTEWWVIQWVLNVLGHSVQMTYFTLSCTVYSLFIATLQRVVFKCTLTNTYISDWYFEWKGDNMSPNFLLLTFCSSFVYGNISCMRANSSSLIMLDSVYHAALLLCHWFSDST